MLGIALALASGLTWGTGDFLGGLAGRRYAVLWVVAVASLGGISLSGTVILVTGDAAPPAHDLLIGAAAGVVGLFALAAFYGGLAIGTMSIVAPISACGSAIPVFWGIIHNGERLSALAVVGIVVVMTGVILASREQDDAHAGKVSPRDHRISIVLAIVAAVGFGSIFTMIAESSSESILWPSFSLKIATMVCAFVAVGICALTRPAMISPRPSGRLWLFPFCVGFFDVSANIMFAASTHHGPLAISSVCSSLYPAMTVMLAYVFLHERLARTQLAGVVLALVGVALLAAS